MCVATCQCVPYKNIFLLIQKRLYTKHNQHPGRLPANSKSKSPAIHLSQVPIKGPWRCMPVSRMNKVYHLCCLSSSACFDTIESSLPHTPLRRNQRCNMPKASARFSPALAHSGSHFASPEPGLCTGDCLVCTSLYSSTAT